jgi:hypothetical protein
MIKRATIVLCIAATLLALLGSAPAGSARFTLDDVRAKHEPNLIAVQGVSAIASDKERNELVVFVENKKICDKIPSELDGIKVRCVETGRIQALSTAAAPESTSQNVSYAAYDRLAADRPVFGGISVGAAASPDSGGTIALVTGRGQILSCAHVLARSSNGQLIGQTMVWQPGGSDGGGTSDAVGRLTRHTQIVFNNNLAANYVDAAYATVSNGTGFVPNAVLNAANNGFDTIRGTGTVSVGDTVYKSGRSTGVTSGQVVATNATVVVYYTQTQWATFRDQILISNQPMFSAAGDSGSAIYKDGQFVGLLIAGSENVSIVNKASYVTSSLGIQI